MKHNNFIALAALVGLAAISVTSMVSSCSKELEVPDIQSPTRISLNVQAFDISQTGYPSEKTKGDIPASFKRLAFKVFDSNGTAVFDTTQVCTQTGFGSIDFLLKEGTYTFVAVGHNVSADKASDPTVVADIASSTLATLPEQNVVDVFCATKQVTVTDADDLTVSMSLPRANSKFTLVMSDEIPTDAKEMEFVLNAAGSETTDTPSLSPSTGFSTSDRQYVRTFDISKVTGKKGQSIGMNLLLIAGTQDIDVQATAYDSNGDVIISRYLEDIPMKQNRVTIATGIFFKAEISSSFSVIDDWDTEKPVTY